VQSFCFFLFAYNLILTQVVVRIRPTNNNGMEGDRTVKKVSSDTLCVGDRQFTFDSVFDSNTNQVKTSLHRVFVIYIFFYPSLILYNSIEVIYLLFI